MHACVEVKTYSIVPSQSMVVSRVFYPPPCVTCVDQVFLRLRTSSQPAKFKDISLQKIQRVGKRDERGLKGWDLLASRCLPGKTSGSHGCGWVSRSSEGLGLGCRDSRLEPAAGAPAPNGMALAVN